MTGSPVQQVGTFVLSRLTASRVLERLAEAGRRGDEAFVLLGGHPAERMVLDELFWPDQTPVATNHGLMVHVKGAALHSANIHFHRAGKTIAAQIHAHPGEAYHSDTDDAFPLATLRGSLSVVVPDFAVGGLADRHRWAAYRLVDTNDWRPSSPDELEIRP